MRISNCQDVRLDGTWMDCRVIQNNDGFYFNSSKYVKISIGASGASMTPCVVRQQSVFHHRQLLFSMRWSVFASGRPITSPSPTV